VGNGWMERGMMDRKGERGKRDGWMDGKRDEWMGDGWMDTERH